jgi:enterochelin esterase family protein
VFIQNYQPFELKSYLLNTIKVESAALKGNPLGDPAVRLNPILMPKNQGEYTCVFYLSGFTSNGHKALNFRSFEKSFVQEIDEWTSEKSIEPKIYVFVDAWTTWGGSQFINSLGCGKYEDYIVQDLVGEVTSQIENNGYQISSFALMGGSSGGYGALNLSSKHPDIFKHCLAIAPDCEFEASLKPEIYHSFADVDANGGVKAVFEKLKKEEFKTSHRSFHTMVNALAMAACYSEVDSSSMPLLPLDKEGGFDQELWGKWLKHDPVNFIKDRIENIKSLQTFFLSVGEFDQFLLQYGARKLRRTLSENDVDFTYEEFKGNHFDIGTRRKKALSLLV